MATTDNAVTYEKRIARKLATDVASYLDSADVPNVLFGWQAVFLAGSPQVCHEVDFVIPDVQIPAAIATIVNAGYEQCKTPDCFELHHDRVGSDSVKEATMMNRFHSIPAAHFHFEDAHHVLYLHTQSSLLWWLPELKAGPPTKDDPDLLLSDDPRLPRVDGIPNGWSHPFRPVKTLNMNSLTEAVLRLVCRDHARDHELGVLWEEMIESLRDSKAHGNFPKTLRPKFRSAWEVINGRVSRGDGNVTGLRALRDQLAKEGGLGPLIDKDNWVPPQDS